MKDCGKLAAGQSNECMMRAERTDRDLTGELASAVSRISVPRIFAIALVSPFAHPFRLIACSVVPGAFAAWTSIAEWGPSGFERVGVEAFQSAQSGASPEERGELAGAAMAHDLFQHGWIVPTIWAGGFLALAVWLCAWQRGTAQGFAEPYGRWLLQSVARLPGYVPALALWCMVGFLGSIAAMTVFAWVMSRFYFGAPIDSPSTRTGFSWLAGGGAAVVLLFTDWLAARLLPLPALVASHGWRRAFGEAWRISRGHGFGLSVALLVIPVLAYVSSLLLSAAIAIPVALLGQSGGIFVLLRVFNLIAFVAMGIPFLWSASLGALLVRERGTRTAEIDPGIFA
jgi:hypothetical protein